MPCLYFTMLAGYLNVKLTFTGSVKALLNASPDTSANIDGVKHTMKIAGPSLSHRVLAAPMA
jgi:hypothetical protein